MITQTLVLTPFLGSELNKSGASLGQQQIASGTGDGRTFSHWGLVPCVDFPIWDPSQCRTLWAGEGVCEQEDQESPSSPSIGLFGEQQQPGYCTQGLAEPVLYLYAQVDQSCTVPTIEVTYPDQPGSYAARLRTGPTDLPDQCYLTDSGTTQVAKEPGSYGARLLCAGDLLPFCLSPGF